MTTVNGIDNVGGDFSEPTTNDNMTNSVAQPTSKTENGFRFENGEKPVSLNIKDTSSRDSWGNKIEFLLATIGFAVGLGNVWRFPYLCQKNGGGAFLIPYFLSLLIFGIPLFLIELGMGQKLRQGAIGAWNEVSPYLGGIGITTFVASIFLCIYYNMIIAWCLYYLFISFQDPLPYHDCPTIDGNTTVPECAMAGKTSYYWYRKALDLSPSIEISGGIQWHLALVLLLAWIIVFLCTMKGVKSMGKAVYVTAIFPYVVLVIFFFRGITLDGAGDGLKRMFTPKFERLQHASVWFEAATQIFYSLGLSYGCLLAMASFNPIKNNCKKDAILVSLINCFTSVFASIVVFSILGFKAKTTLNECLERNLTGTNNSCKSLDEYLGDVAQGTGLSFIAFTEAVTKMPAPQVWAVLFFLMLMTLGMGSMFGTLSGVITPIMDAYPKKIKKEFLTAITCIVLYLIGLLFCQHSGEYWLQLFDSYAINLTLLFVGFVQFIGMNFVYGTDRFLDDIEEMTNSRPGWYWIITWRYLGPVLSFLLFIAGLVDMGRKGVSYTVWDKEKAKTIAGVELPSWGYAMVIIFVLLGLIWIPLVAILRFFGLCKYRGNVHDTATNVSTTRLPLTYNNGNSPGYFDSKL